MRENGWRKLKCISSCSEENGESAKLGEMKKRAKSSIMWRSRK